jgi:predicted Zn-dependent protease
MSSLIYLLGRSLGHVTIPAIRKTKQVWKSLAGNEGGALKAQFQFGDALAKELRMKVGLHQDPARTALLGEIAGRLGARLRDKTRTFRVEVIRHEHPTAVALPGGFLFFSASLLDTCQSNPDELAFVMGHEMAHVVRGHALERMMMRIGAEGLAALVSRGLLSPTLRESGWHWLEVAYPPEAETDADELGARLLLAAGYDKEAPLRWLDRLAALRESSALTGQYLQSHPNEAQRAANLRSVLNVSSPP